MSPVSHQTIQLSKGRHASPEEGACVVELASMLAGEHFSDHPNSVCPVIAALLRNYNDRIDDRRRQDLYPYAAKIVGTRGTAGLERARARHLERLPRRTPTRAMGLAVRAGQSHHPTRWPPAWSNSSAVAVRTRIR